jgi:hypothetical protein
VTVCPVGDVECGPESGDDDRVTEGVDGVGFEGVGLDLECEAEEGRLEKRSRRRRNGRRFFAAVPMLAILVLCRKWESLEVWRARVVFGRCQLAQGCARGMDMPRRAAEVVAYNWQATVGMLNKDD